MRACVVFLLLALAADVAAQELPSEPISVANGRLVIGAEISATIGTDDPGYFNYSDYEFYALRNVRFGISTEVHASERLQVLAEVRVDHGDRLTPYAVFVRLRPWADRRFSVQVGRVPPTFGAFNDTIYAYDNPLIGQPVAYQYLLSLQPTAIPASGDDLVRMRGRGWLSSFPVGDPTPRAGVPIVSTSRYDTGVQVHGVSGILEWTGAVTTGSLSNPMLADNNDRPQIAGRLVAQPAASLRLGTSVARGAWLDQAIDDVMPAGSSVAGGRQTALAVDGEYSAGHLIVRGEVMRASFTVPPLNEPLIDRPLGVWSTILEGQYRLVPGLSLAARVDRVLFDQVASSSGPTPWEADVDRLEIGTDVSITRNLIWKMSWQRNRRDGGRARHVSLVASQLVYWF